MASSNISKTILVETARENLQALPHRQNWRMGHTFWFVIFAAFMLWGIIFFALRAFI